MFGVIHDSEMQMQDDGVYSCCKKAVSCSYGCRKRKDDNELHMSWRTGSGFCKVVIMDADVVSMRITLFAELGAHVQHCRSSKGMGLEEFVLECSPSTLWFSFVLQIR